MYIVILQENEMHDKETRKNYVLLLIDWDNLFINLFNDLGHENVRLSKRFEYLLAWVKEHIGELLGGHGFVFAPEHLSHYDRSICQTHGLKIFICPKENQRQGRKRDTVDETIIWFAQLMADHPDLRYLCLVSGDSDYIDLLRDVKKRGIKVALGIPTINSFSRLAQMPKLADIGLKGQKMILLFENMVLKK